MGRLNAEEQAGIMREIVITLRKYPQGLTLVELKNILKRNRATITYRVKILEAKGWVTIRQVGLTKLIYYRNVQGRSMQNLPA